MKIVGVVLGVVLLLIGGGLFLLGPPGEGGDSPQVVIADVASERLTRLGPVVGFAVDGSHAWLGIPYAGPPVGELRWRAPQRPEPWTDTLDALAYGSACVQLASPLGGVTSEPPGELVGSEDCLHLNVWAPRFDPMAVPGAGERLPVMVWIHGGGNTIGQAGDFYDGSLLATTQRLIVVSLNYRLGPFGWFAHPALAASAASAEERSGNFGTLDLIAGLRWVRDNVEYFGGDPGRVTIFGESAGGTNVVSLLLSPGARGLFHRAIVQSGSTASTSMTEAVHYRDDEPPGHVFSSQEVVSTLLVRDGSAPDREAARRFVGGLGPDAVATYLRGKTSREMMDAYLTEQGQQRIRLPRIFRDGVVLPEAQPLDVLEHVGGYNAVPIMLGSNRDEIKLFFSQNPELVRRYLRIFVRLKDERRYELISRYHSDLWKVNGVDVPAAVLRRAQGPSVYAYRFDWDEEPVFLGADIGVILGAAHGMEIPFVFGHFRLGDPWLSRLIFGPENLPGRKFVSDAMMSYWAEFAYTGTPGRGRAQGLPLWRAWREAEDGEGEFIVFDTPDGGGIRMSSQTVSRQDVIDAVDGEDSLAQAEKCRVFFDLFRHSEDWSPATYREMGRVGCRDHPFEDFAAN